MSLSAVRTAVKNKVAGVAGISGVAPVFDYLRHITDEKEVKDILVGANQTRLHYWCVTPARANPYQTVKSDGSPGRLPANHERAWFSFEIHGYYALKDVDATEKTFWDLVELVLAAFRNDKRLGNTVIDTRPPEVPEFDHRMLSNVLCHHVQLTLAAKEQTEP